MANRIETQGVIAAVGCDQANRELTLRLTCTSIRGAQALFNAFSRAIHSGELHLELPRAGKTIDGEVVGRS